MNRLVIKLALAGSIVVAAVVLIGSSRALLAGQNAVLVLPARPGIRPPPAPSIRIEGDIVGISGSGMLTVRVDGAVQSQQAVAAGAFAVDVPGTRASGIVTIEYAQPGVRFNAIVGSYGRIARLAGVDARLALDECACVRISPISTALGLLVTRRLGHSPMTDLAFDNAIRSVGADIATTTVVLARLALDPGLLPAGYTSGLALLEDHPAFLQYLADTQYEILSADYASTLDAIPPGRLDAGRVPKQFAYLGEVLDVATPTPTAAMVGEQVGTATYTLSGWLAPADLTFSSEFDPDGVLLMHPDQPVVSVSPPVYDCPGTNDDTSLRTELLGYEFRRRWTGGPAEIWQQTAVMAYAYPDCEFQNATVWRQTAFGVLADLSAPRLHGTRPSPTAALPVFCDTSAAFNGTPLGICEYAIHAFNRDGRGEIRELGMKVDAAMRPLAAEGRAPFQWTMGNDGVLHVDTGTEHTRYWVIDRGDGAAVGVVYVAQADRGNGTISVSGYTSMIRASDLDVFATASPLGAWSYASLDVVGRRYIDQEPGGVTRIVRDPSGRSVQWTDGRPGRDDYWTLSNGRLYTTRWRAAPGCVPPIAGCVPSTVRYFRPLARVGGRIHGIEDQYVNTGGDGQPFAPERTVTRPQFHQVREMPVPAAIQASRN